MSDSSSKQLWILKQLGILGNPDTLCIGAIQKTKFWNDRLASFFQNAIGIHLFQDPLPSGVYTISKLGFCFANSQGFAIRKGLLSYS